MKGSTTRVGTWLLCLTGATLALAGGWADAGAPTVSESLAASVRAVSIFDRGEADGERIRALPALPAGFFADRKGPEIFGSGDGRSSGESRATEAGDRPLLPPGLPATSVSPALASRAAAARCGLFSAGCRAPPPSFR